MNKYLVYLSAFITLLFLINAYNLTLNSRPGFVHQWRQSDCLSITTNYYREGMKFLNPKLHWQGNSDGSAVSELPLINFTVALLWKVFGKSEGIYRLFNYLIYLFGIFVLFKTLLKRSANQLIPFFLVSLILTSPLFTYYSFNFLSDVPAFSLSVISFCLILNTYEQGKSAALYTALLTATLAVLLKASACIPYLLLVVMYLLEVSGMNKRLGMRPVFRSNWLAQLALFISILGILSWYAFAKYYNDVHHSNIFLIGVLPVWGMDTSEILHNLTALFSEKFAIFLNRPMLFLFFGLNVFLCFHFKHLDALLKLAYILSGVFFLAYLLLFFKVFDNHDYYLVNLMFFPVVNFFCLVKVFQRINFHAGKSKWLVTFIVVIISFNSLYSAAIYRLRSIKGDKLCYWYPFLTIYEKESMEVNLWNYEQTMKILETAEPKLRKLGIQREDLVLSVPDFSPNSSLYLMDQKGYTISYQDFCKDTLWKPHCRYDLCKYMILNDTTLKDSLTFKLISKDLDRIYKEKNLEIYRLNKTL